ncbi:methyltransferase domain-containing protein [Ktedonosporobacter rubrisoli]|uniref:Methyltransferase domain-containing protein n=1 Tax=Ktedonosporobacter rubrisoli TaxID=2509675 RepID=A0A4P6K0M9_KTERU|nr:class I SAM-dependent methyltransferase [Ktedonosporobacter rubrisoli]QBD80956.1 methyltransferase domain-containing protein [Ktedonosporobacter rubrisoli]
MLDAAHSRPPVATEGIAAETQRLGFKRASHPQTEALLRTLAASKPGGTLLELGTGTGMGTAWLLDGMDASARLLTLDQNEETVAIARKYLGADTRVKFLLVDVAEFVQAQPASSFDLIFADCYPGKFYLLDEALALLKKGGIYVVDDMRPAPEGEMKSAR